MAAIPHHAVQDSLHFLQASIRHLPDTLGVVRVAGRLLPDTIQVLKTAQGWSWFQFVPSIIGGVIGAGAAVVAQVVSVRLRHTDTKRSIFARMRDFLSQMQAVGVQIRQLPAGGRIDPIYLLEASVQLESWDSTRAETFVIRDQLFVNRVDLIAQRLRLAIRWVEFADANQNKFANAEEEVVTQRRQQARQLLEDSGAEASGLLNDLRTLKETELKYFHLGR